MVKPLPERARLISFWNSPPRLVPEINDGPDIIHFFAETREELFRRLAVYRKSIDQNGSIWVSWYKKAAEMTTEITEGLIREAALPLGLADVKVCGVDEKRPGLKLVIRCENRI